MNIGHVLLTSTISPAHLRRVIGITVLILLVMLWLPAGQLEARSFAASPPPTLLHLERLSLEDGQPNNSGVAVPLHITPSFWQTSWFQGVLALLAVLVMAGGGLYSWRVFSIRAQSRLLEQTVAQRTAELRLAQVELTQQR